MQNSLREIVMPGRRFAMKALHLGLPIIIQNFIMFALNMMDIILLQGKGDTAVAAVSIANQANQVINLLIFGTCSGCSIFVAQCRGSRDFISMRKTVALALSILGSVTLCSALLMSIFPSTVMRIMTNVPALVDTGARYLRIASFSYILSGMSLVFSTLLRCNEKTKLPLVASIIALSLNTGLNYLLIYGKWGFPEMGAVGAAVATVISRMVEFGIILYFVYGGDEQEIKPFFKDFIGITRQFCGRFFKIAAPVMCNEIIWGLGMTIYSTIYGRMGESTVAAMSVASIMEQTFAVVAIGCGHITTIMVGQQLGHEKFERAKQYAKTLSLWAVLLGLATTLLMIAVAPFFVRVIFSNLSQETMHIATGLIIMFACYMPVRAFNYTNIVGTLRSGGDSLYAAIFDVGPMYLFSIPAGFILGLWLRWPPITVIAIMYGEEFIKGICGFLRMIQYKWVRKIG